MHLVRMKVSRLHHRRRGLHLLIHIARIEKKRVARRPPAQILRKARLLRQSGTSAPFDFQLRRRLNRLPWLLRHHADEVVLHDDFHHAWQIFDRRFVNAHQPRAHHWRTHHAPVQHARHAHVVDELEPPGHDFRKIRPRHRRAKYFPLARIFAVRLRIERQTELLPAH